jgi:PAS domain S-box-containing protein
MGTLEGGRRAPERRWLGLTPARAPSLAAGQAVAVLAVAVAAGARVATAQTVGAESPFLVFVPAVLIASLFGGYSGGVTATLASAVAGAALYLLSHPAVDAAGRAWLLAAGVLVGVMVSLVGGFTAHTLRALARSENRFRSLALATSLVILRFDAECRVLSANADWRRLTGQAKESLPGAWREMFHPDDLAKIPSLPGATLELELRLRHAAAAGEGSYRWVRLSLAPVEQGGRAVEWLGAIEDIHDRKSAEQQTETLAQELAHRARNGLAVVQAIITQSARQSLTAEDLAASLTSRLQAMARAQDAIAWEGGGEAAPVGELLHKILAPFDLQRFDIRIGASVSVERNKAVALGLMFHELATNAVKYGALSVPDGRVMISVSRQGHDGPVDLQWREHGGPAVTASNEEGFGLRLLGAGLRPYGGQATVRMPPGGLECDLTFNPAPA